MSEAKLKLPETGGSDLNTDRRPSASRNYDTLGHSASGVSLDRLQALAQPKRKRHRAERYGGQGRNH